MKTLVIVDMQPYFLNSTKEKGIIPNVIKSVRYAIQQGWPIIVVEYDGCGNTHDDIVAEVLKSPRYEFVTKSDCSGGKEVSKVCEERGWPNNFVVCGVYGDQCVAHTVAALLDIHGTVVNIIKDAVYPEYVSVDSDDDDLVDLITIDESPQPNAFIRARENV